MGKHQFTWSERFAVWKHHGPSCFWCGEPLRLQETTIDHFIPEYLENKPAELDGVRTDYGLSDNFVINDYCNWLPCHDRCNRGKGTKLPWPIFQAAATLKELTRDAETIRSIEQRIKSNVTKDKLLAQVMVAFETNALTKDEILALFPDTELLQDEDIQILRKEIFLNIDQHFVDFLNRKPDQSSLAFWSNQITEAQQSSAASDSDARLINISAAFFLSIEFQENGYLVYRMYKAAYGQIPGGPVPIRLSEFLPAVQQIGRGVIVGKGDWQTQLESNKVAFALDFVSRSRFTFAYPTSLTPAQFVDALYMNAGVTPSAAERTSAIKGFGAAATTLDTVARARSLRRVAENSTLAQQEFNKAFVLMEYFGYLRRNPNDTPDTDFSGYNFWLGKLNQFNGDFVAAGMVKAFITSSEYKQRFGSEAGQWPASE